MNILRKSILFILMLVGMQAWGQQGNLIAITPFVEPIDGVPETAMRTLSNKLKQIATQNGFGAQGGEFVLTCNVIPIDKQAIPTMPVQYSLELEVSLYVVNMLEDIIIDEYAVNVSGLESNEGKAYAQAFMQINPRNPQIKAFMGGCREKIKQYYTDKLPAIMAKAQSLATSDDYEGALAVLGAIPDCIPQYADVAKMSSDIYVQMLDRDARTAISQAKGALAQRNYGEAIDYISTVHPGSTLAKEAYALIDKVQSTIRAEENFQYQEKLRLAAEKKEAAERVWSDNVELEKLRTQAAAKTAVAQAQIVTESNGSFTKDLRKWLLGKLK